MDLGDLPIRPGLVDALEKTWHDIARPGARWAGAQRVDIARTARTATTDDGPAATQLPAAAAEAATLLARAPATTTEEWATHVIEQIGEREYVELVGVVARIVAVDTFFRLLGLQPPTLLDPVEGEPSDEPVPDSARRKRTWVRMVTPLAPLVLGAVPSTEAAVNALCDRLYMHPTQIGDASFGRGLLDRPRIELVAATVSQVNECFY
jgi:alkylhydroperoxidase family enzyme